jgi:[acyl-carrier-protein] S-malonyltransferase
MSDPDIAEFITARFHALPVDPKLALIFPGQGAQAVGMGRGAVGSSPVARHVFELADRTLETEVSALCFGGPAGELTRTSNAQPAILTASVAILCSALESRTVHRRPSFMAGHSLGEFTALVAAGSLRFENALKLVRDRGRLMEEAGVEQPGTMAAIVGLSEEDVADLCELSGAEPCNYNSPSQVVVGGTSANVEAACRLAKEAGGRGLPLNVSGAFHTSLMDSAASEFTRILHGFVACDPEIPVVGNVAAACLADAAAVLTDLREQISAPVRWHQSISLMIENGVRNIIEVGPGRALATTLKRSYPGITSLSIDGSTPLASLTSV